MKLSSSAFHDGAPIPRRFTCDGENVSPPLFWSGAPAEGKSFVLVCVDPDAPRGTWHHWGVYDIAHDCVSLSENISVHDGALKQGVNDFGSTGYGGPCPPRGHGPHRYHFRLFSMPVKHLSVKPNPSCKDILRAVNRHAIEETTLIGLYER